MSRHRRSITWKDTEPVRLYLYSVLVPVVALLVLRGLVTLEESALWLGIGAAALGVPAVEKVRQLVSSPATVRQLEADHSAAIVQATREGFDAGQVNALQEVAQTIRVEPAAVKLTEAGVQLEDTAQSIQAQLEAMERRRRHNGEG